MIECIATYGHKNKYISIMISCFDNDTKKKIKEENTLFKLKKF